MAENNDQLVPTLPPELATYGNRFTRWLGRLGLVILGWRVVGNFPKEKKFVMALAPHTSNWDFVVAMFGLLATGIRLSFLMKKEAFFWPFRDMFIRMGGIPLDRKAAEDTVEQIRRWFEDHEQVCVAITPEGTRSKVEKWKTGFLRIAEHARVPVFIIAWDYPGKRIVLDRFWELGENDHSVEAEKIRAYINQKYVGRHPHLQ